MSTHKMTGAVLMMAFLQYSSVGLSWDDPMLPSSLATSRAGSCPASLVAYWATEKRQLVLSGSSFSSMRSPYTLSTLFFIGVRWEQTQTYQSNRRANVFVE